MGLGVLTVSSPLDARTEDSPMLHVVGGAGARTPTGTPLFASWPFAVLTLDDDGVTLSIRAHWVLKLLRLVWFPIRGSLEWEGRKWWSATWPEVVKVETSRRGIAIHRRDGSTCRFVSLWHRTNAVIIECLHSKGIITVQVWSTMFKQVL